MITRKLTHAKEALSRLVSQYQDRPLIARLIASLTQEIQNLENVLIDILESLYLDTAVGDRLVQLGRIVGQDKAFSSSDEEYRILIRTRIVANRSSANITSILRVFWVALQDPSQVLLQIYPPAGFHLFMLSQMSNDRASFFKRLLTQIKGAGIRGLLIWFPETPEKTFTLATSAYLSADVLSTDSFLPVTHGDLLPFSGEVILDEGLATEETITYVKVTDDVLSPDFSLSFDHDEGCAVTLTNTIGKGFEDDPDADVGGHLAGAI